MNKSDSERAAALLEKIGYIPASSEQEADLIIANMCSVRQSAVDRVLGFGKIFPGLKAKNPNLKNLPASLITWQKWKWTEN